MTARVNAPHNESYTWKPASKKQRDYIEKLRAERDATGTKYEGWEPDWSKAGLRDASAVISFLQTLPVVEKKAGIYAADGQLFRVYLGQKSGTMLVKSIESGTKQRLDGEPETVIGYHYLGSVGKFLPKNAKRLSVEEVGELGKAFDHCVVCGRRLDDPESVDRGIGPICAKAY